MTIKAVETYRFNLLKMKGEMEMHCILQIVTKGKPTMIQIDQIMSPYYENDFYKQWYDPATDEFKEIPAEAYPPFTWDYYTIWEDGPSSSYEIGECYAMIDRQGRAHVRKRYNGHGYEDLSSDFDYWVKRMTRERGPNDWITVVNYHY